MRTWIALTSLLLIAAPAAATGLPAGDETIRIWVYSDAAGLREQLGVRHDFGSHFSTIVPLEVHRVLVGQGVPTEPVVFHQIQVVMDKTYYEPAYGGALDALPEDATPYGIEQIYNNAGIASTSGGAGVRLGHLDTGIDQDHPDLVNRIAACTQTTGNSCQDQNGHGTHTAGSAAADAGADDAGIWGVASEASIYTIKVCSNGGLCGIDDTIEAIDLCINTYGCNVITFSIGGDGASANERNKITDFNNANGLFIAANGNDGSASCTIDYPGAFKEALGIAAIDSAKKVPSFSSRGCSADANTYDEDGETDYAAAGVSVESTYKGNGRVYKKLSGTSMATPHVAGLAVKKWTGNRGTTLGALEAGVEDITQSTGGGAGAGVDIASGRGLPHV